MQKGLAEAKPLIFLVARGGIEAPTQEFSILCFKILEAQFFSYPIPENKKAA
jgi:hypothetical protein